MSFVKKVEVCDEPLKKFCNETVKVEEVCRTEYETSCETRFKNHTVEQEEPVKVEEVCRTEYETSCETRFKNHTVEQEEPICEMVMAKKCDAVVVDNQNQSNNRRRRRSTALNRKWRTIYPSDG